MAGHSNIPELDKLFQDVSTYRSSKNYMELFDFIKRFRKIAPYNAMLIHMQKPGSKYVASAEEWRKEFQRTPKPGARPLIILRTFGPVSFVYELEDTEGKEFPQELQNPFQPEGEISEAGFASFVENLYFNGFRIFGENYGTEYAGAVQAINYREPYTDEHNTRHSFRIPFAITINSNHNALTQLATIYHELGPCLLRASGESGA